MKNTLTVKVAGIFLASFICIGNCSYVGAAEPVGSPNAASSSAAAPFSDKELLLLEDRFFSRQYANDPIEKRLERIELLVFASTQDGTNDERLARLKKTLADRVATKSPAATAAAPAPTKAGDSADDSKTAAATAPAKKPETSSQYPVLNTLEWRALKKTFPAESLDLRLQRLETKLFGQDSPAMAYVDRIDRLKRVLGIGVTAAEPVIGPRGPMPKARPRGDSTDTFGWSTPNFPSRREIMPRFGGDSAMPPNLMNKDMMQTFNQLFQQMNKQLQDLDRMAPGGGGWNIDPEDGALPETGKKPKSINPLPLDQGQGPRQMLPPIFRFAQPEEKLPAYTDPNSI